MLSKFGFLKKDNHLKFLSKITFFFLSFSKISIFFFLIIVEWRLMHEKVIKKLIRIFFYRCLSSHFENALRTLKWFNITAVQKKSFMIQFKPDSLYSLLGYLQSRSVFHADHEYVIIFQVLTIPLLNS